MTSRPRHLWPWIVATIVAVPVLYVASFGPILLALNRSSRPEWAQAAVSYYSLPLYWGILIIGKCDEESAMTVNGWITAYVTLWVAP